jgi:hypothetical protein
MELRELEHPRPPQFWHNSQLTVFVLITAPKKIIQI